jgi:precorrin-6Y C5,15-methyltransferase (decarboxylating)
VAIEWMLRDPSLRAIALERRADRAARIVRNAAACGVPALQVVTAAAPAACAELPKPNAIFIGGGASESGVLDAAARALRPGGRLVVNAITLASETLLLNRHAVLGGELLRLAISRAEPLGEKLAWRAAMPVTQWQWTKP